ncbi:right-handed parallel beta-helix repeat-containing protein [Sandarakinorhabdus sp.]|uniref:right-handed parallel beta-helix repeat-containing protein n=1 Tax=Sandarakinorhabdus sp. TaxID=1916663 RepID=UPI00286DBB0B|nr:PEPxxWA-CTERM sorting domain-containing protein [Sandarakinorhabdus sp.]
MKISVAKSCLLAIAGIGSLPVSAATITVLPGELAAKFALAQNGDVLVLKGAFDRTQIANRTFTSAVTIDARGATFANGLSVRNVSNVTFLGGTWGSLTTPLSSNNALGINTGANITVRGATFLGMQSGQGVIATNISNMTVQSNTFQGLKVGVSFFGVNNGILSGNNVTKSASDGFNIVDSRSVRATSNSCSNFTPGLGAHPDCIQLWASADKPMQENISLIGNRAVGAMQGFTSFDPKAASGKNLRFEGNYIEGIFPQGIACYGCFDSVIINNTLIAMPTATWRTSLNVVGGANNTVYGNILIDRRVKAGDIGIAAGELDGFADGGFARSFESDFADAQSVFAQGFDASDLLDFEASSLPGNVPEPAIWAQLILGFGLIGAVRRRRTVALAA